MARSRSMQRLTDQTKQLYPGVVIYGIGDAAHKRSPSGHNEDDTPGSKPEETDADNKPEHRAIDVMIGRAFTEAQAWQYVTWLVMYPENRNRLRYVIYSGNIWSANNDWVVRHYNGPDPHTNHVHVSGTAGDDENIKNWQLVTKLNIFEGKKLTMKLIYAPGRAWALVGDTFTEITDEVKANSTALVFGNAQHLTAKDYDNIKAIFGVK